MLHRRFQNLSRLINHNFVIKIKNMGDTELNKDLILREQLAIQRTRLANQSTFLSLLRSAMYFLIAGLSIHNFYTVGSGLVIELFLYSFAALLFILGTYNYWFQLRLIKKSEIHVGAYKIEYLLKKSK